MENAGRVVAEEAAKHLPPPPGRVGVVAGPGNNGGDGSAAAHYLAQWGYTIDLWYVVPPSEIRSPAARRCYERAAKRFPVHVGPTSASELSGLSLDRRRRPGNRTGRAAEDLLPAGPRRDQRVGDPGPRHRHADGARGPEGAPPEVDGHPDRPQGGHERPDLRGDRRAGHRDPPGSADRDRTRRVPVLPDPRREGTAGPLREGVRHRGRPVLGRPGPRRARRTSHRRRARHGDRAEAGRRADPGVLAQPRRPARSGRTGSARGTSSGSARFSTRPARRRSSSAWARGATRRRRTPSRPCSKQSSGPCRSSSTPTGSTRSRTPPDARAATTSWRRRTHGEFVRVFQGQPDGADADRLRSVRSIAAERGLTLLVKGPDDLISDGRSVAINANHHPAMTVSGSGDVLAGTVGALLGEGIPAIGACRLASYLVGEAGTRGASERGFGLIATDILDRMPAALVEGLARVRPPVQARCVGLRIATRSGPGPGSPSRAPARRPGRPGSPRRTLRGRP